MKIFAICYINGDWFSLDVHNFEIFGEIQSVQKEATYISFQVSDFIREIKGKKLPLPFIIDLEGYDRQFSQRKTEIEQKNWKALFFLRSHKLIDRTFRLSEKSIKKFLEHIAEAFLKLKEEQPEEWDRYVDIEIPVNRIIHKRQLEGICINSKGIASRRRLLEKEIYKVKLILQLKYNILKPQDIHMQKKYLQRRHKISGTLLNSFKIYKSEDECCRLFYQLLRRQSDLDTLIYLDAVYGGKNRTHPYFVGFGSISSRITLREPALQNLRRRNRDIIRADDGQELIYLDYSQFEAGILASLSKDSLLIEQYDRGIYNALVDHVNQETFTRKDAKIIFYRFLYGDTNLPDIFRNYFSSFKGIDDYKKELLEEFKKNGYVETEFGNRRMGEEDENWYLSHVIQGTVSLILKKAILEAERELKDAEFLIPMHDAVLYQVPLDRIEEMKLNLKGIFEKNYKQICPLINPKVEFKNFSYEEQYEDVVQLEKV